MNKSKKVALFAFLFLAKRLFVVGVERGCSEGWLVNCVNKQALSFFSSLSNIDKSQ